MILKTNSKESQVVSNIKNSEEEFVPLSKVAQTYADQLNKILQDDLPEEKIIITVSSTMSVVRFKEENVTYIKMFDGVWKTL